MYESVGYYLIGFASALLLTYLLTPLTEKISRRLGIFMDLPGERRLHTDAVPRCGGLALWSGFQLSALVLLCLPGFERVSGNFSWEWWEHYLIASSVLLTLGLLDDYRSLSWWVKLLGQIAAATFMFSCGVSVNSILAVELSALLDLIVTILWFTAMINAFNLIDGLDGLATGLAIAGAVGLAAVSFMSRSPADTIFLLTLVGACLGFLRFNFHPARIFLGDSGSMFLGFTLAAMALSRGAKITMLTALSIPLLAAGVPIFDTLLAIWRRAVRHWIGVQLSGGIAHADMEHLHHRLVRAGLSQRKVAFLLYGVALLTAGVGILSIMYNTQAGAILFLALIAAGYVIVRHIAHTELWDSGSLIVAGLRRPSRPVLALVLYPLCDLLFLAVALLGMLWLTARELSGAEFKVLFMKLLPVWVGLPYLALVFSGAYTRVWSRARVSEFVFLGAALGIGLAGVLGFTALGSDIELRILITDTVLYGALAGVMIAGVRALPRAVSDLMEYFAAKRKHAAAKMLVYGAGLSCSLYLKNQYARMLQSGTPIRLVGLVDDDANLRKRVVHGYKVLGRSEELPTLVAEHQITKIVLACNPPREQRIRLMRFCAARNISLYEWRCTEAPLVEINAATQAA